MLVRALCALSEIDSRADWLWAHPGYSSLIVVISDSHLRRIRICGPVLRPRNIQIAFLAAPEENAAPDQRNWWKDVSIRKMVLAECFKIACYLVFLPLWKLARSWRSKTISSIAPN